MDKNLELLIFSCGDNAYAVDPKNIERVIRVVEITPIANSPLSLLGVFNLQGRTIPVFSLRRLFSLEEKSVELEDILIILHVKKELIALLADQVVGVFDCNEESSADADEQFSGLFPEKIVQWEESLLPVIDIEKLIDEKLLHHA
jgi:purine-binding chemotaxis protein CheW